MYHKLTTHIAIALPWVVYVNLILPEATPLQLNAIILGSGVFVGVHLVLGARTHDAGR